MQVSDLFTTPLWEFSHPDLALLQEWSNHILALERGDRTGLAITNQWGWHSRTDLLGDPDLQGLYLWIAAGTEQAVDDFGWNTNLVRPCFNNAWVMVNRRGDSVRAHLHPNSLFSGVLYLRSGEQRRDRLPRSSRRSPGAAAATARPGQRPRLQPHTAEAEDRSATAISRMAVAGGGA